tara:strand:- start:1069 stop:1740 length:672 start_codon:yes stop_codon:yes gene_type:complete
MKKIIIYTTHDEVISLHLVNSIIADPQFKNYKIDIKLSYPSFLRKIKILFVIIFFGSIKIFLKSLQNKISLKNILDNNKNCKIIKNVIDDYDYGLSVYCSEKIQTQNFKIYNFHLGNLKYQRGSFIFFYKFIKNWDKISLTFHEISEKFDVGKIINEREINLKENCKATDIFFLYLNNKDFLIQSIHKITNDENKEYKNYDKLHLVPGLFKLLFLITNYYLKK